jgi:hypothetical protein
LEHQVAEFFFSELIGNANTETFEKTLLETISAVLIQIGDHILRPPKIPIPSSTGSRHLRVGPQDG